MILRFTFAFVDVITDCILQHCASANPQSNNQQSYAFKVTCLQILTVSSVIFFVFECILLCCGCCGDDSDESDECSDNLSVITVWVEDVPKSLVNTCFMWHHPSTSHPFHAVKAVVTLARAMKRLAGVRSENRHDFRNVRHTSSCARLYLCGISAELLITVFGLVMKL